jgi:hypothetical protein
MKLNEKDGFSFIYLYFDNTHFVIAYCKKQKPYNSQMDCMAF